MKKLKTVALVIFVPVLLALVACGNKYSDAEEIMEKQADTMEAYCDRVEKAGNAEDIIKAVDNFSADMEKLAAKMEGFREKYPELYKTPGEMPPELEKANQRMQELTQRMTAASMKMAQHMLNPKVQQAMMKLGTTMAKMGD